MRSNLQLTFLAVLTSCSAYNYSTFNVWTGNQVEGPTTSCLHRILEEAGWRESRFFIISNTTWNYYNNRFLGKLDYFTYMLSDGINIKLTGQMNLIIFTANFDSLREILFDNNIDHMDASSEILVFLKDSYKDINDVQEASKGISNMFWNANKPSAVFYIRTNHHIMIATFDGFEDNCRPGPIKVVTTCRFGVFADNNVEIFPKKMMNAHNCTMNCTWMLHDVMTASFMPKAFLPSQFSVNNAGKKLVKMLADDINLKLYITDQQHEIDITKQGFGKHAHIAVAGFIPTPKKLESLELLPGFEQDGLVLTYHDRLISEYYWANIFLPFRREVWLAIFFTCSLSGLNMLACRYICKKSTLSMSKISFFYFIEALFAHGRLKSKTVASRSSYFFWAVYSFYITTAYSSGLYHYLTKEEETNGYETFQRLDKSGLMIGGTGEARDFFEDRENSALMSLHDKYQVFSHAQASKLLNNGTIATAISKTLVARENMRLSGTEKRPYRKLSEKLLTFVTPMYVSRGSPIITVIKPRILYLHDYGFVQYWKDFYAHIRKSRGNKKDAIRFKVKKVGDSLKSEHFRSLFCIFIAGMIISLVVFTLERYKRICVKTIK